MLSADYIVHTPYSIVLLSVSFSATMILLRLTNTMIYYKYSFYLHQSFSNSVEMSIFKIRSDILHLWLWVYHSRDSHPSAARGTSNHFHLDPNSLRPILGRDKFTFFKDFRGRVWSPLAFIWSYFSPTPFYIYAFAVSMWLGASHHWEGAQLVWRDGMFICKS